jgi:cytochrome c oxidase subunit 2
MTRSFRGTPSRRRGFSKLLPFTVAGVLVLGLVFTVHAERVQAPARTVRITAERFQFTPSEVSVTAGTEIEFQLTSEDTAHGFRILGQSVDITIPKRGRGEASVRFTPPAAGRYVFECSRMCGAGHSFMRGTIVVKPETGAAR